MDWAALAYTLAALALVYPALSGQLLMNPHSDQHIAGFAFRDLAAQSLRAGQGIQGDPFMLAGPISSYASPWRDGKLFVSALLPLALWLLVRGIRNRRTWAWGTFALTIGLAVLSPHPQLLQYGLLTSGAFAFFLAFGHDVAGAPLALTATTTAFGPGKANISLSAPAFAGLALIVSENYFPGWHVTVDGREVPVYRSDFNLIGVPLPAGARTVALAFHDAAVTTGKTIALLAWGAGLFTDRRSRVA